MKKLLFILISLICCFILFGCESNSAINTSENNSEVNSTNDKSADEHVNVVELNESTDDLEAETKEDEEEEVYEFEPTDITKYLTFSASTELDGEYSIQNIVDGDLSSAWVEGAVEDGIGESIKVSCPYEFVVTSISIYNGYQKSESLLNANGQVKSVFLSSKDYEANYEFEITETIGTPQVIAIEEKEQVEQNEFTIYINDVYQGSKYSDTCISEILVYGYIGELNDDVSSERYGISLNESMNEEYEVTVQVTVTKENAVIWTYTFESYTMTELDQCQAIGIINNRYLCIISGRVYAFDVSTGELLWISEDSTGASCHYDFDEDNNLYICGSYGPDLLVIDSEGKTLYYYDSLSEYYWPYRIRYINEMVFITYSSEVEDVTIKVDPQNGIARSAEDEESSTVVQSYESEYGSFEVTVPILWKCKEYPFYEATEYMEASPDGGIQINIDDESIISIDVSLARIYYNGTFIENIQTEDGVTAKAYSSDDDGRITQIKFTDSMGVIINCNNYTYDKYESDIMSLIKTIKIK